MIKDPAVQAIVNGGTGHFLTLRQKIERYVLWFLVAAVAILGALYLATNGLARQANSASRKANVSVQSQCLFFYGVGLASGPTIPPTTTEVGLSILVGARVAYEGLNCALGDLPKAAPQVASRLPVGTH